MKREERRKLQRTRGWAAFSKGTFDLELLAALAQRRAYCARFPPDDVCWLARQGERHLARLDMGSSQRAADTARERTGNRSLPRAQRREGSDDRKHFGIDVTPGGPRRFGLLEGEHSCAFAHEHCFSPRGA